VEDLIKNVIKAFGDIMTSAVYGQGEIIHQENKVSNTIFILNSGVLRSYYFVDGKDITAHFAVDSGLIGAADSLIKGKKSLYTIEALERSEVFLLDYGEMESFLDNNPHLERLARQVLQVLYIDLVERLEGMTFLSAKKRYDHLLRRYPDITQRLNLGHIASYLGITKETLSRVRGLK